MNATRIRIDATWTSAQQNKNLQEDYEMATRKEKTCFDPENYGSIPRNREGRVLGVKRGRGNPYTSTNVSSNGIALRSPLQYLLKCLCRESPLALRIIPQARHLARLPAPLMCRPHSHFPRKHLSHTLQHHFPRMWLNMGVAW